jgi:hypothetical protein
MVAVSFHSRWKFPPAAFYQNPGLQLQKERFWGGFYIFQHIYLEIIHSVKVVTSPLMLGLGSWHLVECLDV